jgi:hypothetical protein
MSFLGKKKKDNKTHLCRHPEHAQACSVKTQKAQPTFKHKLKVAFTLKWTWRQNAGATVAYSLKRHTFSYQDPSRYVSWWHENEFLVFLPNNKTKKYNYIYIYIYINKCKSCDFGGKYSLFFYLIPCYLLLVVALVNLLAFQAPFPSTCYLFSRDI